MLGAGLFERGCAMRPLDDWLGRTAVSRMATVDEVDAYVRAFVADAVMGVQAPFTAAECAAIEARRAELLETRLRAERAALRSKR
jgi:hypothetical protein